MESESHFLLYCTYYDDFRVSVFKGPARQNQLKLEWLFNFDVFTFANFASKMRKRRQDGLFSVYFDFSSRLEL